MHNWIIFLLIGLLIGTVGGLTGLGGGFVLVPILLFMGFEAQRAVGTSFAVIVMISISALLSIASCKTWITNSPSSSVWGDHRRAGRGEVG